MFKLTVIAGPTRGASYDLKEGEFSIGRQSGNSAVIASTKISKRHCVFVVSSSEVVLKDQGSSNGTFVNGILTKVKKLVPGDRISVGEYVFELVAAKAKASVAPSGAHGHAPANAASAFGQPMQIPGGMPGGTFGGIPAGALGGASAIGSSIQGPPKDIKGKIIWAFEHNLMPIFYGLNLKHEWAILCIALFSVFVLGSLVICIYPLLESNRVTIVKEAGKRARFMARQIAEQNAPYLAAHAETKTDLGLIESAEGVRVAVLIDLDSRIIAPGSKLNQYLAAGDEAAVAVNAKNRFLAGGETGYWTEAGTDTVVGVEPVKILNPAAGRNVVAGIALVSVDTSQSTPDLGEMGMIYSEALILLGLLGGSILLILYKVTLKPFQALNEDMDKALKGDITQVTHEYKFQELNSLWDIINSAIQRVGRSNSGGADGGIADAASLSEEFLGPLRMIGNLEKFGFVVFNADRKIGYLNPMFEEISGIRADGAVGHEMTEVARDQSMAAFTLDILSRAPAGGEGVTEDYEISGVGYKICVAAFGTPGGSPKSYILVALKAEG